MSEFETEIFGVSISHALNRLRQCARDRNLTEPEKTFTGVISCDWYKKVGEETIICLSTETATGSNARKNVLTIKKPVNKFHPNVNQWVEESIVVVDTVATNKFINFLGYGQYNSTVRDREIWLFNGSRLAFVIDGGESIFLMIETADKKHMLDIRDDLGYPLEPWNKE